MLDNLSMIKLNQMCRSHGWEVVFNPLSVVGTSSENELDLKYNGEFLGKARLKLVDPSKRESLPLVKEIIELFLEPKLYQQLLQNRETAVTREISWSKNLKDISILDDEDSDQELLAQKILSKVFEFKDSAHYSARQFADDIHQLSQNWAFLEQGSMKIDSAEELIKLGAVTWYIAEPTATDVDTIVNYLARKVEVNEWATIIMGPTQEGLTTSESKLPRQRVDLRNFPLQTGLRRDVIRLLLGVS